MLQKSKLDYAGIRYWCQDETRLGLITLTGKKITSCGIQMSSYSCRGVIKPLAECRNLNITRKDAEERENP